eukprot:7136343-Pyramimonas_sp.AAC.1
MGACCRTGVPARTGAFPRVRQPAPIPIASPPPNDPLMGMGVCCLFVNLGVVLPHGSCSPGVGPQDHHVPVQLA